MRNRRVGKVLFGLGLLLALSSYSNALWIFAKAEVAQLLIAQAWEKTLATGEWQKPWDWADTWPVARLQHPASGSNYYILEGSQGNALAFGPGHQQGTALPGEQGISLIGGHRDTHFRFLKEAQLRDELLVQTAQGHWQRYEISLREIHDIRKDQLSLETHAQQLVLVTCYPFDAIHPNGPLRLVVYADKLITS